MSVYHECKTCYGTGVEAYKPETGQLEPCRNCGGSGLVQALMVPTFMQEILRDNRTRDGENVSRSGEYKAQPSVPDRGVL